MTIGRNQTIEYGDSGVMQTLDAMANLVTASIRLPLIIETARFIIGNARGQYAQAVALRAWLKRRWQFVDDPYNVELLVEPVKALEYLQSSGTLKGDCDEVATLGATLGGAIGIPSTFVVLAFADDTGDDRLCHVFTNLLTDDGRVVDLDITRPTSGVPAPTRAIEVHVFS